MMVFWVGYLAFLIILLVTMFSERTFLAVRIITVILLAFLASRFRMSRPYSFLSVCVACLAAVMTGMIIGNSSLEFIIITMIFIASYFGSVYVWEKNLLGI